MNAMRAVAFSTLLLLSSCEEVALPAASPAVEYRPELAGTVDHAMCLLGFTAAPIRRLATGHQVIDGALNGKPATFVVDTGANVSVVHSGFGDHFGLTPERGVAGAAIGLGGGLQAARSRIESLRVGPVAARQSHLMIADLSQLERLLGRLAGAPIHGIVGQDLLNEHRAVIDAARPMLYLQQEDVEPAPVPVGRCTAAETQASASS